MPVGFVVDVEFVWGFQARIAGLSKTSPSFYYPPPTTFLGAIAEVTAKEYDIGENLGRFIINELARNLLAIGWRPINCIPIKYEDINRILAMKRTSGVLYPSPSDLNKSFDAPARGKTALASLNEEAPKVRWILVFNDKRIEVRDNLLKKKIEEIYLNKDIFWKIHRLGSKESKVSVTKVELLEARRKSDQYVATKLAFPISSTDITSKEKTPRWENEVYVNPYIGENERIYGKNIGILNKLMRRNLNVMVFKIPMITSYINLPEYVVRLKKGWNFYEIETNKEREMVIGK